MSDPTTAEMRTALETLERVLGKGKRYTRAQLDAMTPEQVADALRENEHAFDAIEEAEA